MTRKGEEKNFAASGARAQVLQKAFAVPGRERIFRERRQQLRIRMRLYRSLRPQAGCNEFFHRVHLRFSISAGTYWRPSPAFAPFFENAPGGESCANPARISRPRSRTSAVRAS